MTAIDERRGLGVGGLRAQLADLTHERDQLRAALLGASAAADLASAARLDWWADGYRAGFESGRSVGYGQAVTDWKVTATNTGWNRTTHAALDRRRYPLDGDPRNYPLGGRLTWLIPRPSDLGGLYDDWASYDGGREGGQ